MEELFGEGKERGVSLSDSSDQLLLFCTGCIWDCAVIVQAWATMENDTGVLEHLGLCLQHCKDMLSVPISGGITLNWAICKTARSCPFYQNCSVWFMNCIVKHYLSTFQKSFYFPLLCPLLSSPLSPLLSSLLLTSPLFSLLCLSWAVTKPL